MERPVMSLCTVCMNRLDSLRQTLPANLDSDHAEKCEFILVDYNSTDGLEEWVRSEMMPYIKTGRLRYFRLVEPMPLYFSHSHSRNTAFRLAKSDIVCNVNADYFLEPEFFVTIPMHMETDDRKAIILSYSDAESDNFGRICLRKDDFFNIGGYDERFISHGYEDIDLCSRLILSGVSIQQLNEKFWSRYIAQDNDSRIKNSFDYHNIQSIHFKKIDDQHTRILFLFKSGQAQSGTLEKSNHDVPILLEGEWQEGYWRIKNNNIVAKFSGEAEISFSKQTSAVSTEGPFSTVLNEREFKKIIFLKSQILNYSLMRANIRNKTAKVNSKGFPRVVLKENFESEVVLAAEELCMS